MQIKRKATALGLASAILLTCMAGCRRDEVPSSDVSGTGTTAASTAGSAASGEETRPVESGESSPEASAPGITGNNQTQSKTTVAVTGNHKPTSAPTAARKLEGNVYTSGFPLVKNKVTLSVMVKKMTQHVNGFDKMAFSTEYEKKTGVHVEWQIVDSGDFSQRVTTAMSSGKYPDLIFGIDSLTSPQVERYASSKMFLSLEDAVEKWAPNALAAIKSDPSYKGQVYFGNKLYSLPSTDDNLGHEMFPYKMFINKKWLDALNLKMPTTYDELLKVLQRFKKDDPNGNRQADEIPFSCAPMSPLICGAPQGIEWFPDKNDACYVDRNGKVGYFYTSDACKNSLSFLRKVFNASCMDWAAFCGTQSVKTSVNTGRVGCFIDYTGTLSLPAEKCADYVAIGPIKADANAKPTVPTGRMILVYPYAAVITAAAAKDQKKEVAMRWLDWFYTKEGDFYRQFGPENTGYYTPNGDGTYKRGTKMENGKEISLGDSDRYAFAPGWVIPGRKYDHTDMWTYKDLGKDPLGVFFDEQDVKQIAKLYTPHINKNYLGYLKISAANANKLTGYKSTLHAYAENCMIKFVSGDMNIDTEWNDFVTKAKKYGADDVVKIYQNAYNNNK